MQQKNISHVGYFTVDTDLAGNGQFRFGNIQFRGFRVKLQELFSCQVSSYLSDIYFNHISPIVTIIAIHKIFVKIKSTEEIIRTYSDFVLK